ncbi:MAG: glycosyltransferase, partial [Solirubrobacterales bacterium]|nr:glycosyltransferase [Solirubrobacterales bacterium]
GRHGLWQRPLERRRLAQAPLLVPQDPGALHEAGDPRTPSVVVRIPVEPSGPPEPKDLAAVTYATNPYKKGLDRILVAWRDVDAELVVAGVDGRDTDGVRYAGRLEPAAFRALLRRAKVYVTAPRREDYGLAQLEALADGCRVVTTGAPGPYAALPLLRELGHVTDDAGLAGAVRAALADADPGYAARALDALAPFRREAVDRIVAGDLLPALLRGA